MLQRTVAIGFVALLLIERTLGLDAPSGPDTPPVGTQSEMTFRTTAHEVSLGFHIAASNGRPVTGVKQEQLTVYQDGQPVPITSFSADDRLPLHLVLMIDSSSSMSKEFDRQCSAAADFVRRVVRPDIDQSTVLAFSARAITVAGSEISSPEAAQQIEKLHSAGLTALFDALYDAAHRAGAGEPETARRVVVVLTDGDDNFSRHSLHEALAAALGSNVVIYAITAHNPKNGERQDANLQNLTSATGGRLFFLRKYAQPEKVFAEIEQEIRSQYSVTFRPGTSSCGFHSVGVETNDRSLKIRLRVGFFGDCS